MENTPAFFTGKVLSGGGGGGTRVCFPPKRNMLLRLTFSPCVPPIKGPQIIKKLAGIPLCVCVAVQYTASYGRHAGEIGDDIVSIDFLPMNVYIQTSIANNNHNCVVCQPPLTFWV